MSLSFLQDDVVVDCDDAVVHLEGLVRVPLSRIGGFGITVGQDHRDWTPLYDGRALKKRAV